MCHWVTCATVVSYPATSGEISDDQLQRVLAKVALAHLAIRLDEVQDWAKVLSPGEQQRIAFARVLLTRPKAVFLDEATSALDEGLEFALYELVRSELSNTIRGQRQPPSAPSSSTTSSTWNCSAAGNGGWAASREPSPRRCSHRAG